MTFLKTTAVLQEFPAFFSLNATTIIVSTQNIFNIVDPGLSYSQTSLSDGVGDMGQVV